MDSNVLKISHNNYFKARKCGTNKVLKVLLKAFIKSRRKARAINNTELLQAKGKNLKAIISASNKYEKNESFESNQTLREIKEKYNVNSYHIVEIIRNLKLNNGLKCVHCDDVHIVKYGMARGKQRYKCKSCNKTFIDLFDTPLMMSHHIEKWFGFIECTIKSLSLRESSKILGISHVTLFYWRHKLLSLLKKTKITKLEGILEICETYFMYSEKGKRNIKDREPRKRGAYVFEKMYGKKVCVLAVKDEINNTLSQIASMGRLGRNHIEELIGKYVDSSNEICTGSLSAYVSYSNMKKIKHYRIVNVKDKIHGQPNIKRVIEFLEHLNDWILIFRGVATKYLNNYLAWHKFLESINYENSEKSIEAMLNSVVL